MVGQRQFSSHESGHESSPIGNAYLALNHCDGLGFLKPTWQPRAPLNHPQNWSQIGNALTGATLTIL